MKPKLSTLLGMLAAMLVIVYVLSVGPVFRAMMLPALRASQEDYDLSLGSPFRQARTKWEAASEIYTPLFWLTHQSRALHAALTWYLDRWTGGELGRLRDRFERNGANADPGSLYRR